MSRQRASAIESKIAIYLVASIGCFQSVLRIVAKVKNWPRMNAFSAIAVDFQTFHPRFDWRNLRRLAEQSTSTYMPQIFNENV